MKSLLILSVIGRIKAVLLEMSLKDEFNLGNRIKSNRKLQAWLQFVFYKVCSQGTIQIL